MNSYKHIFIVTLALSLSGCATNDFKVLDALHPGMTRAEATSTVESFSFSIFASAIRPIDGWTDSVKHKLDIYWWAQWAEDKMQEPVERVDLFPVGHGILGMGELYLFYNNTDHLIYFYRLNIN